MCWNMTLKKQKKSHSYKTGIYIPGSWEVFFSHPCKKKNLSLPNSAAAWGRSRFRSSKDWPPFKRSDSAGWKIRKSIFQHPIEEGTIWCVFESNRREPTVPPAPPPQRFLRENSKKTLEHTSNRKNRVFIKRILSDLDFGISGICFLGGCWNFHWVFLECQFVPMGFLLLAFAVREGRLSDKHFY